MQTRTHSRSHVLLRNATVLTMLCYCQNSSRDPGCERTGLDPVAAATVADIGLFTESGAPIELPGAVVSCAQGSSGFDRAQYRPEHGLGVVLVNGSFQIARGEGVLFNYYVCGIGIILRRCGEPLRVRVEAPGCEPYERVFTWDDNFDLNGPYQFNFRVPVRLRCAADAGADPSMRDIYVHNYDVIDVARDVFRARDTGADLDGSSP